MGLVEKAGDRLVGVGKFVCKAVRKYGSQVVRQSGSTFAHE